MANHCASLDATFSHHLPAPAPALWPYTAGARFSPAAAAFENDALASALAHASASPSSPTPSSSTTTTTASSASELSSAPHDAPAHAQPVTCRPGSAAPARQCTGRVSKRKPRASRRPPATYITADPADFRRMVQEITGLGGVPGADHASAIPPPRRPDPLAFVLPTLDTSACFLLDQAPPQRWEDKASAGAATGMAAAAGSGAVHDSSQLLMQELEAMMSAPAAASAFPTLDSWDFI